MTISPNLYYRDGHGTPEDVAAKVRAAGGVPDAQMVGDVEGSLRYLRALPNCSGKVGCFGTCSGGRQTIIAASHLNFDAAIDCWGGRVVMAQSDLNPKQPVAPIDLTKDLKCPLLGLFGNDDQAPTAAQVDQHEEELKKHGKTYEFHRYDNAGHGFFYYDRPAYRQEQAVDGWKKSLCVPGKTPRDCRVCQRPCKGVQRMCTMIVPQAKIDGCGKGTAGVV